MPTNVKYAVIAVCISIGLAILGTLGDKLSGIIQDGEFVFNLIIYSLFFILPYKISNQSNSARYVWLALVIIGAVMWIGLSDIKMSALMEISAYVSTFFEVISIYLLFTSESNNWFKRVNN
ncbi:hypothetical protein MTYP_01900 [Methylophilaceae bacterium]|nr:hypothetical protein MTYP_01900 [Methylophilaceae bacterium]